MNDPANNLFRALNEIFNEIMNQKIPDKEKAESLREAAKGMERVYRAEIQELDGYGRCPNCGENYSAIEGLYECPECSEVP